MKILDRLPILKADMLAYVGQEGVRLKKDEIIIWVSLTIESAAPWHQATPRFPAIVDTGHTHNFAIQNQHLVRWAGIQPTALRPMGHIRHDGKRMPLHALKVWLHRNLRGSPSISPEPPVALELPSGIAVYSDGGNYPRLPILGLRALLSNELYVTIDGEHASVTMRTPDWRTRVLAWLAG